MISEYKHTEGSLIHISESWLSMKKSTASNGTSDVVLAFVRVGKESIGGLQRMTAYPPLIYSWFCTNWFFGHERYIRCLFVNWKRSPYLYSGWASSGWCIVVHCQCLFFSGRFWARSDVPMSAIRLSQQGLLSEVMKHIKLLTLQFLRYHHWRKFSFSVRTTTTAPASPPAQASSAPALAVPVSTQPSPLLLLLFSSSL